MNHSRTASSTLTVVPPSIAPLVPSQMATPVHSRVSSVIPQGSTFGSPHLNRSHAASPLSPPFLQNTVGRELSATASSAVRPQAMSSLAFTPSLRELPHPLPPIRDRVVKFYTKYNPSKLGSINTILESYAGQEAQLMTALVQKYGPEEVWWHHAEAPARSQTTESQQRQPDLSASAQRPPTPLAPSSSASLSFAARLHEILQRNDPSKVHLIPQMLITFKGSEENLINGLIRKYQLTSSSAAAPSQHATTQQHQQQPQQQQQQHPIAQVGSSVLGAGGMPASPLNHEFQRSSVITTTETQPLSRMLPPNPKVDSNESVPSVEVNSTKLRPKENGTKRPSLAALEVSDSSCSDEESEASSTPAHTHVQGTPDSSKATPSQPQPQPPQRPATPPLPPAPPRGAEEVDAKSASLTVQVTPENSVHQRSGRDGIVISPALFIGRSASNGGSSVGGNSLLEERHARSHDAAPTRMATTIGGSAIPYAASMDDGSETSLGDRPRLAHPTDHDSGVATSVSPMTSHLRSPSVGSLHLTHENVGCELIDREQRSEHSKTPAATRSHSSQQPKSLSSTEGHERSHNAAPTSPKRGATMTQLKHPLWVSATANGKFLSTIYDKSKDEVLNNSIATAPPRLRQQHSAELDRIAATARETPSRVSTSKPSPIRRPQVKDSKPPPAPPQQRPVVLDTPVMHTNGRQQVLERSVTPPGPINSGAAKSERRKLVITPTRRAPAAEKRNSTADAAGRDEDISSRRSRRAASPVQDDVVICDLRRDFRPNLKNPPGLDYLILKKTSKSSTPQSTDNESPLPSSRPLSRSKVRSKSSDSVLHRAPTVVLEHIPAMLPFEQYSSFRDPTPGRPSAWAKAPQKTGIFSTSPVRIRTSNRSTSPPDTSLGSLDISPVRRRETINGQVVATCTRVDDKGRLVKVICDAPISKEAIEAQQQLSKRLSTPRTIYVRKEENV